ncbi:MAG: Sua5/YciO/YrdC/YwlC family protein [Mariprofundaceae bacterium]|nr:Sua5/YciO/YrdC/YwlC family protein [Mariprofundaceae bacterium]
MRHGCLIAHPTATLPGVAASPLHRQAMQDMARFKQRPGPFLLLADTLRTAWRLAIYIPVPLRREMQQSWPGTTTFVLPARSAKKTGLAANFHVKRCIAIRVDADAECRFLAAQVGGLLASSSLNRKGQQVQTPERRLRMRMHRHFSAVIAGKSGTGHASQILRWQGNRLHVLRPSHVDNTE